MQVYPKIKNLIFKIYAKCKFRFQKDVYLSLGENCLTDDILKRYDLKSFSTPFSSCRSNIEYILFFEKRNYKDFLNQQFLKSEQALEKQVVRNKIIEKKIKNQYDELCSKGFEFTHHDVRKNEVKDVIQKRCNRMLRLKRKNITFLYHHRACNATNEPLLISHLNELKEIYEHRGNRVNICVFTQRIIPSNQERKVEKHIDSEIKYYTFYTYEKWEGANQDVFWARCDDDLIQKMIDDIKSSHR